MKKGRSKSSDRWMKEHLGDPHVKQAQADGYRSRAVYKLIELDKKDGLLKPGMAVLELGAAPGGWTQYVAAKLGERGRIVATDILEMDGLAGVEFIQGDFTEESVLLQLEAALGDRGADLVLSDMAPNISGVAVSDQARAIGLADLALDIACTVLNEKGAFAVKLFQGEGFDGYIRDMRARFQSVKLRKPAASRARSREVYAVARNLV